MIGYMIVNKDMKHRDNDVTFTVGNVYTYVTDMDCKIE